MSSARQMISSVRSEHKLLSADALLSDRAILAELKRSSRKLIKQQSDKRRLWQTDSIFTTLNCLELIEVPLSECCEYTSYQKLSRSKHKLPRIGEGIFQYLIKSVMNIDGTKKLEEVSPERYINLLKLKIRKNTTYYWIMNGYIYTTNSELKALRLTAFFEEDVPSYIKYPKCDACKGQDIVDCTNPYDEEFKAPGFLEKDIVDMTSQKLLGTYHKLQEDFSSDNQNQPGK